MFEFLLNLFGSALVGFVLWLALPRGIALIPEEFGKTKDGEVVYDTWFVKNMSPHQIQLLRVRKRMWCKGTTLQNVDIRDKQAVSELRAGINTNMTSGSLVHYEKSWKEIVINPGVQVSFYVHLHTELEIIYRRKGLFGFFERKKLVLRGCA